jgi:hypothetical protein
MKQNLKFSHTLAPLAFSLGMLLATSPADAQTVGGAPYINSWVGNTYGLPADHIAHNIENLYVTPSGKVATITGWDEGGSNAALYSSSGAKLGIPVESGTGSWGRSSGTAIFVNDSYLYQSMKQAGGYDADGVKYPVDPNTSWKAIRRYNHDGSAAPFSGGKGYDSSMLVVNEGTAGQTPTGVLVLNSELYVSDPIAGQVKVYNASTMSATPVRSFAIANPGLLDHDRFGFIWMLDTVQKKLVRFSTTGTLRSQVIQFPAAVIPTAFCVDKVNDRILVANNGAAQNVLIYTKINGTPAQTSTFGNTGGINSGTAGAVAPLKFHEPKGVGIDSAGNIYVGNDGLAGGGHRLEKYNSSGVLQWRLNGLVFTGNGSTNPANETEFYTHNYKFNLNLSNTTPGSEWSPAAMTINKVKYPGDVRLNKTFWTTAYVRAISGRKLLYASDMYSGTLAIYRFNTSTDGETAIPAGHFNSGDFGRSEPDLLWGDVNGNGVKDAGETETYPLESSGGTHYFPDTAGGVWKSNRDHATARIRHFPLQGFDASGIPQYSYASSLTYSAPEIYEVKRLEYDATADVLYASGRSTSTIADDWGVAGNRLVRYNNFKNAASRATAWMIDLPFSGAGSPASDTNVKAFCEAGDYLFLSAYRQGRIYVHRKTDGAKIGEILPTSTTGNTSGWSDINGAIRATKRANGEYLIFAEENGYGKIMMYRWSPAGSATPGPNLTANPSFDAQAFDTQTPSDWNEWECDANGATVPPTSSYTESLGGSNSGSRHGTHWKSTAYKVYTYQTLTGLANGMYTLRGYFKKSGNQVTCTFEAKDCGSPDKKFNIPSSSNYQLLEIPNINVTNGQCTIGVWSDANAQDWIYFDDISLTRQ